MAFPLGLCPQVPFSLETAGNFSVNSFFAFLILSRIFSDPPPDLTKVSVPLVPIFLILDLSEDVISIFSFLIGRGPCFLTPGTGDLSSLFPSINLDILSLFFPSDVIHPTTGSTLGFMYSFTNLDAQSLIGLTALDKAPDIIPPIKLLP